MFVALKQLFYNNLYIRLSPQLLSIKNTHTGELYADEPILAIDKNQPKNAAPGKILAAGKEAHTLSRQPDVKIANGFDHPRTLISDFVVAEKTLQHFVVAAHRNAFLKPAPAVILHPLTSLDGRLTDVEERALKEMAAAAGARQVLIWTGRELTDDEVNEALQQNSLANLL